jgi:hypothetical protein
MGQGKLGKVPENRRRTKDCVYSNQLELRNESRLSIILRLENGSLLKIPCANLSGISSYLRAEKEA